MTCTNRNLQETFLSYLVNHKTASTVFLANGVKLQGVVTSYDEASLLLQREGHVQLIFKHAISTIMPNDMIRLDVESEAGRGQAEGAAA